MLEPIEAVASFVIGVAANLAYGTGAWLLRGYRTLSEHAPVRIQEHRQGPSETATVQDRVKVLATDIPLVKAILRLPPDQEPLLTLLTLPSFQDDLSHWITSWDEWQRNAHERAIVEQVSSILASLGHSDDTLSTVAREYPQQLRRLILEDPELGLWRLGLAAEALMDKLDDVDNALGVALLQADDPEAADAVTTETADLCPTAGNASPPDNIPDLQEQLMKLHLALHELPQEVGKLLHSSRSQYTDLQRQEAHLTYCRRILTLWDLVELGNLPADEPALAERILELRKLYLPLRLVPQGQGSDAINNAETRRAYTRLSEAGRAAVLVTRAERVAPGDVISHQKRVVVLGDPGAGKSTLMRWLLTAYALQHLDPAAFTALPDVNTVPVSLPLPILIRCRDIRSDESCTGLLRLLEESLGQTELGPLLSALMASVRDRLSSDVPSGLLLLVDGLDEIPTVVRRERLCRQIEKWSVLWPGVTFIVTSRIVGYRQMAMRLSTSFRHYTIDELRPSEKDIFARRWCHLLQGQDSDSYASKLIRDIHSHDRIERITGNPMLLTTLVLVRRKLGRLPQRRSDLYQESVLVLLRWRSDVDEPLEEREALPQLEYIAYNMCAQERQHVEDDMIVEMLSTFREEYPRCREAARRTPCDLLSLLESRSGLLMQSGSTLRDGLERPVYEFRHLTFQEYLAARALAYERYPDARKKGSLVGHVTELAKGVSRNDTSRWRETLRLLVCMREKDDVDDMLRGILEASGPVFAAECLADEPSVLDDVAEVVVRAFVKSFRASSTERKIGHALMNTRWSNTLRAELLEAATASMSESHLRFIVDLVLAEYPSEPEERASWWDVRAQWLSSKDPAQREWLLIALADRRGAQKLQAPELCMELLTQVVVGHPTNAWVAHALRNVATAGLSSGLVYRLNKAQVVALARVAADPYTDESVAGVLAELLEMSSRTVLPTRELQKSDMKLLLRDEDPQVRSAAAEAVGRLVLVECVPDLIAILSDADSRVVLAAIRALGQIGIQEAIPDLIKLCRASDTEVASLACQVLGTLRADVAVTELCAVVQYREEAVVVSAVVALGRIGDQAAVSHLVRLLGVDSHWVRRAAVGALAGFEDECTRRVLSRDCDGHRPWVDPLDEFGTLRIQYVSRKLGMMHEEVVSRLRQLSKQWNWALSLKGLS